MRSSKFYADRNLNRAYYDKCKRIDNAAMVAVVIALACLFLSAFINNFPK